MKYTRIIAAMLLPLAAQAAPVETAPGNVRPVPGSINLGGPQAVRSANQNPQMLPGKGILAIGSAAPAVKFGGFHKGDEISALDPEKTYIIEFWAIKCGPCVAAMPHLTELAKRAGDSVIAIGVNAWKDSAESIKTFLEQQGDKVGYRIASDSEGFMVKNWLEAAGARGIPFAFIVSKGKVMWIGHPGELELETINGIRDGKLTAEAMGKTYDENLACSAEFGYPMMETKGDAKLAIEKLKGIAAKHPDATFPALMTARFEERMNDLPDGEPTLKSEDQGSVGAKTITSEAQVDTSAPEAQELMNLIVGGANKSSGKSREFSLKWQDGHKVYCVTENSKLLFNGPVDTEEGRAKIPEGLKQEFSRLWILGKIAKKPGESRTPAEKEQYKKAVEEYEKAPR